MNLQKKREQEDALQVKKKSITLKGTQEESSIEESTNEDDNDLAFVLSKENKMMRRKFYKKTCFQKSNFKKEKAGHSNCF